MARVSWFNTKKVFLVSIIFTIHGFFSTSIFFLSILSEYHDGIFKQISDEYLKKDLNEKELALALMNETHNLLKPRLKLFKNKPKIGFRDKFLRSSDINLIDNRIDCGGYALVLGNLLDKAKYKFRFGQMSCSSNNLYGCHIIVEAKINGKYSILDPTFNLYFINQDQSLASVREVLKNWDNYKNQVPDDYNMEYDYHGMRYTNWDKIPIVSKVVKKIMYYFMGDQIEVFSARKYLINRYNFLFSPLHQ